MPQVTQVTLDSADQAFTLNGGTEQILVWSVPGSIDVEWTEGGSYQWEIRGGGGGGGFGRGFMPGGGGGAGGRLTGTATAVVGLQSGTVGAGGTAGTTFSNAGQNTVFGGQTAVGGGHGSNGEYATDADSDGGSGGGASRDGADAIQPPGSGTAGQGFDGGLATTGGVAGQYPSGGGGGAGSAGLDTDDQLGGDGGLGVTSNITGSAEDVCGGGGGGSVYDGGETKGLGTHGGGDGYARDTSRKPTSGVPGTGGGGGGGASSTDRAAGEGGSGAIILRFTLPASGPTVEERSFAISSGADVSGLSGVIESRSVALAPSATVFGLGGQDIALVTGNVVEYTYTITDSAGNVRVFNDTVTVGASSEWLLTVEGDDLLLSTPQTLALSGDDLILEVA